MDLKIIIFIAVLCVANASVIIANFKDASESEVLSTKASCTTHRECRQRCADLGFLRGNCSAGRCLCFTPMKVEVSNPEVLSTKASCTTHRECGQRCADLGFLRGNCSAGRCLCFTPMKAEEPQ